MKKQSEPESWAKGLADLPARCRETALSAASLLRGPAIEEAASLVGCGIVATSKKSLCQAAAVFKDITNLKCCGRRSSRPKDEDGLHLIHTLARTIQTLEKQADFKILLTWWKWRETRGCLKQVLEVNGQLTIGQFKKVQKALALKVKIQSAPTVGGNRRLKMQFYSGN